MSASKRRVEGYDYLYQRGHSYEVRVQVPQPLKAIVGKGELKKSLGSDMRQVGKKHPGVLAGFLAQLEAARGSGSTDNHRPNHTRNRPTPEQVHAACYAHFLRMSRNMRGKVAYPTGDNPRTRLNRIAGFQSMIDNQVSALENGAWSIMAGDAERLCVEHGWMLAPDDELFHDLCGLMIRARNQCYRNEVRQLKGLMGPDPDADPMFGPASPVPSKPSMTLGDLVTKFTTARDVNWSTSTTKNYIIIFRVIEELCGKDTPLADIDNDFCISIRNRLRELPSNYQKRPATRGKSLSEAIEIGARDGLPKISPATVNSHLNKLGAIIRYGQKRGLIVGDAMEEVEVKDPVADEDKRDPFKVHHLNAIFASEPWVSGPGAASARPSRYWAPLISLFSGARLTEICGQLVSEMVEEHGVRVFDFRHRPGVRDMKNDKSRMVPVHPKLIRLGFWDYVEEARASKRELLFPDVSRNKLGNWGDPTSKWFARLIDRLALKGTALCFHSFRHTFEDGLKVIELADTPIGNVITGRVSPGVSKNYGSRYTVTKLAEAIGRVDFEGLDLPDAMFATKDAQ